MKALGNFVILKKIKSKKTKIGVLELNESQDDDARYALGEVISFGSFVNERTNSDSEKLQVGDKVKYDSRAGHGDPQEDGTLYWVIKADSIAYIV